MRTATPPGSGIQKVFYLSTTLPLYISITPASLPFHPADIQVFQTFTGIRHPLQPS